MSLRWRSPFVSITFVVLVLPIVLTLCLFVLVSSASPRVREYQGARYYELRYGPGRAKAAWDLSACLVWQLGLSTKPKDLIMFELIKSMLCPTTPSPSGLQ